MANVSSSLKKTSSANTQTHSFSHHSCSCGRGASDPREATRCDDCVHLEKLKGRWEEDPEERKQATRKQRRRCCGNPPSVVFTLASCCHCSHFLSQRNASFLCSHIPQFSPLCLSPLLVRWMHFYFTGGAKVFRNSCVKTNDFRVSMSGNLLEGVDYKMHKYVKFDLSVVKNSFTNQMARPRRNKCLIWFGQTQLNSNTSPLYLISPLCTSIFPPLPLFLFCFVFLVTSSVRGPSPSSPQDLSVNLLSGFPLLLLRFSVCFLSWGERPPLWLGMLPARRAVTVLWVLADFIIFIIGRLPPWQSH